MTLDVDQLRYQESQATKATKLDIAAKIDITRPVARCVAWYKSQSPFKLQRFFLGLFEDRLVDFEDRIY